MSLSLRPQKTLICCEYVPPQKQIIIKNYYIQTFILSLKDNYQTSKKKIKGGKQSNNTECGVGIGTS